MDGLYVLGLFQENGGGGLDVSAYAMQGMMG